MSLEKLKSIGLMGQNKALDTLIPLVDLSELCVANIICNTHETRLRPKKRKNK
jgi:hypothetical protein